MSISGNAGPRLFRRPEAYQPLWLEAARSLVEERFEPRLDQLLPPFRRLRVELLRHGDLEGPRLLAGLEVETSSRPVLLRREWRDGALHLHARSTLARAGEPVRFERRAGRVVRPLSAELAERLGRDTVDCTDLSGGHLEVKVCSRHTWVSGTYRAGSICASSTEMTARSWQPSAKASWTRGSWRLGIRCRPGRGASSCV